MCLWVADVNKSKRWEALDLSDNQKLPFEQSHPLLLPRHLYFATSKVAPFHTSPSTIHRKRTREHHPPFTGLAKTHPTQPTNTHSRNDVNTSRTVWNRRTRALQVRHLTPIPLSIHPFPQPQDCYPPHSRATLKSNVQFL